MTHPSLGPGKLAPDVINAIVEIPTGSRVKYEYAHVETLEDLPPHFMKEVEHFFLTYKDLEEKDVHSDGWAGKEAAKAFVMRCIAAYAG